MGNWILVVDDDTSNLRMANHILSVAKKRVSSLKSGVAAIKFLQANRPDLILLDIHMPEMDGFETIAAIKENEATADIPVIFLSADDDSETRIKGLEAGAIDFIKKPFVPEVLLRKIDNSHYIKYGISIENGLYLASGDIELYLDLIDTFLKERKKQNTMQQFIAEQNMKDYAIFVHGLKGNARTLGADKLADIAYEHEIKSKAGEVEYVKTHWDELIAAWENTLCGFQEYYSVNCAEEDDKYGMVNGNGDDVLKLSENDLAEVVTLLDDFETTKAIEKLKAWISTPLKQDMHERLKGALIALEDEFDEDKAIELLKNSGGN